MKKLMFAAAAVAMTSGAFAAPLVYDYKASVKHMYLKEIKVSVKSVGFSGVVYQKYQKAASLKGYLIMDQDGFLSKSCTNGPCDATDPATSWDYGRNRGFLVVLNSSADKNTKHAKIIPAVLDAKWMDTAFSKLHAASSGLAEGYLFLGGDSIAPVRPALHDVTAKDVDDGAEIELASTAPAAAAAGISTYADYVWTSVYLFGQFNGPNWFKQATGAFPFRDFEAKWDANLPTTLQTGRVWDETDLIVNAYHDTWMNGSGIGKYMTPNATTAGDLCCGLAPTKTYYSRVLNTLSGNLKGGVYLCTENGIDSDPYEFYDWAIDGIAWEDQFNCFRCDDPAGHTRTYAKDNWQNDLFHDGAVEQVQGDVIYGTWSIKLNAKFMSTIAKSLTATEEATILASDVPVLATPKIGAFTALTDYSIWFAIKGAALKLDPNVKLFNGEEIYNIPATSRFAVPMMTPSFVKYYGLAVQTL